MNKHEALIACNYFNALFFSKEDDNMTYILSGVEQKIIDEMN